MQLDHVKSHLMSNIKVPPYFLFVSDGRYKAVLDELDFLKVDVVSTSDFCGDDDKQPDIDAVISHLEAADLNVETKKLVVVGFGEYLALRGNDEAARWLSRLKNLNVGKAKVVLLLRGMAAQLDKLRTDPRFDNRRFSVIENAECDLSFTVTSPSVGLPAVSGFQALLAELEDGRYGNIFVSTVVNLDNSLFTVRHIKSAYDGIVRFYAKDFLLPRSCGSDEQWSGLLTELRQSDGSLEAVFENNGFNRNIDSNFYERISGNEYHNWLYFIFLKSKADTLQSGYLRFVLDKTGRFEDFAVNVLNLIIEVSYKDKRFEAFYHERKVMVEKFPEADIADFVLNSRQVVSETIFKLTDQTMAEREEIIAWLSKNGAVPRLGTIYPVLSAYLKKYIFKGIEDAEFMTEYFTAYKRQKLANEIEPDFLEMVDKLAHERQFVNHLPTRNILIDRIDKNDTFLFWLDSLGVEYLSLIEDLVQKRDLSIKINIARAELPTITSINRDFYDAWQGRKDESKALDDVKHRPSEHYNFTDNRLPIHLAKELDIIVETIEKAATELALRRCKRFLIVSDHGASRLAVLRRKEEKYDTDTVSKYSGRCCMLFPDYDLPFAAEENGYLVLADYGRFKGSRAANVEVHGGASLEEMIVPVIELTLKSGNIMVKLLNEDEIFVDFRKGVAINLFFNTPVHDVSLVLNGVPYTAVQTGDKQHYTVSVPEMKRAGEYPADIFSGDNLIGKITIKAQGRVGKVNDGFDDLF